jgi:hypothetical protein
MLTLLAKSAAAAAVQSTASRGTSVLALDVKIKLPSRGSRRWPRAARDRHSAAPGKRLAIATAEVMHGDVRVAVLTGTTALTPSASLA